MKKIKTSQRAQAYFWMLINTVVWGAAFIAVKPALNFIPASRYLLYRYFFALIFSLPILLTFKSQFKKVAKILPQLIFIELLGTFLTLWLLYIGLSLTTAIEANLLATSSPLFITLGGIFFLKERQEKHEWQGLSLGFLGTILLVLTPVLIFGKQIELSSLWGNLLIIISMVTTAIYYLLAKKTYQKIPMFLITAISFYVGFFSFLPLSWWQFKLTPLSLQISFWQQILVDFLHKEVWLASLYMAFFGSIIGLTAYYKGQQKIEASEASLFTYLQPLVAIPLGILILGERVFAVQLIALAIIILGVYWAEKRKR